MIFLKNMLRLFTYILILLLQSYSFVYASTSNHWEDQIVYFIMIDRFSNGDKTNDNQGVGEFDPNNEAKYHGGDLKGIIKNLYYLKKLGITAIWTTPPVANQWWDPWSNFSGYHGYWTENFVKVDKHYGDLQTYKELSSLIHQNNMLLIQDIVCNHVGNFFRYKDNKYDEKNPAFNYEKNVLAKPYSEPTQYPFNMNDPRIAEYRKANIYHWTPDIENYNDVKQKLNFQMSTVDDLNTSNPLVVDTLKDSFNFWIKEVGVDAFRIDTVAYVEHEFWNNFIHSSDTKHPGVKVFAAQMGNNNFFTFGENWKVSSPYNIDGDLEVAKYLGTESKPELDGMLNFPLNSLLKSVFKDGRPTAILSYQLKNLINIYKDNSHILNFIDNHDMPRFLSNGNLISFKQALTFIMTIPGIPVIYYGTEQGFTEMRKMMDGSFNSSSDLFKFMQNLILLRKQNEAFRRGDINILKDEKSSSGVLAYSMTTANDNAYVFFNTSDFPKFIDSIEIEQPFVKFKKLFAMSKRSFKNLYTDKDGKFSVILGPKDVLVIKSTKEKQKNIEDYRKNLVNEYKKISQEFCIDEISNFTKVAEYSDKIGDDYGPNGLYKYPTDNTFNRQMDIEKVEVFTSQYNLKISVTMADKISDVWNPANSFDHVLFNIFLSITKMGEGVSEMPGLNSKLPNDMKWNYFAQIGGWSNILVNSNNKNVSPVPLINVDKENRRIDFTFYGISLGKPKDYKGTKIYISTWDYDGNDAHNRGLEPKAKSFTFGGGAEGMPYVMDDIGVISF